MTTIPLGEVARFIRGVTFKPGDVSDSPLPEHIGVLRTKNIQQELDLRDVVYIPRDLIRRDQQLLAPNDILISSANSWNLVGKCCWVPHLQSTYAIGGFVTGLRVESKLVDARYLYRWLSSPRTQAELRNTANKTTNIANLSLRRCEELPLPLPTLAEQRRIAAILDHADALRAKRRVASARFDDLRTSIFYATFGDPILNQMGWPVYRFEEIITSMQYGPRFYNEAYSEHGVRIVRITDLDNKGHLDFESMPRMDVDDDDLKKYCLTPGDIVFARTGATVGKLAVIRTADPQCIAGAYFIRIQLRAGVDPDFIAAVLRSDSIQSIIVSGSHQSAQQNFSGPGIRALQIPLPPVDLQRQFARTAAALAERKAAGTWAASQLDSLFASLQSRAFSGQL